MYLKRHRGFTLIELLVVIAIIGVLASVVLASLNGARVQSRDAARKAALNQVSKALDLYFQDYGTYRVSGGGSGGGGLGWLSLGNGGSYPIAVTQQLANLGYLGGYIVDPSGAVQGSSSGRSGYMIYTNADGSAFTLWANLENPSAADIATQSSCPVSTYDGYSGSYAAGSRMNYCIGH